MREDERLIERGRPSRSMVSSCVEKEKKRKKEEYAVEARWRRKMETKKTPHRARKSKLFVLARAENTTHTDRDRKIEK
jgi:hypothetical protein